MVAQVGAARIRAWNSGIAGIREVFHRRFTDHAYPKHTHDVWTLFIVDDGAIRYDLECRAGGAETSMVSKRRHTLWSGGTSLCQILRPNHAVTASMRRSMSRWELNR
jgi:hypothetical protein